MELKERTPLLLQVTVIILMSVAASYAFQRTEIAYQINGLGLYRYTAYAIAVFLGYVCFSQYKKYLGLAFSFALSTVALSPIGHEAIELFPWVVPFLATFMGVTTVLMIPSSRGKGFFGFLVVLILPAILAVSRIGGSFRLLVTTESIGYHELSAITVVIIGGYFYLRYAALANLTSLKFLSNGGNKKDVAEVSRQYNILLLLITLSASAVAALLMVTALFVADALRATVAVLPLYVPALVLGVGIAITAIFYIFQISYKETTHIS